MEKGNVDVDRILHTLGKFGRWQIIQLCLLVLTNVPWAFAILSVVFVSFVPDFRCIQENRTSEERFNDTYDNACHVTNILDNTTSACVSGYEFDVDDLQQSTVSEWSLVCDRGLLAETSQTMLYVGLMIGSFLFPPIADRIGRKWVFIFTEFGLLASALVASFVPSITWFILCRVLVGIFCMGVGLIGFIITMELFPVELRMDMSMAHQVWWGGGLLILAAVGYAFRHESWRHFQMFLASISLMMIAHIFFIDESIRWLYANDKDKQAQSVIRKAAKRNGIEWSKVCPLLIQEQALPTISKLETHIALGENHQCDTKNELSDMSVNHSDQDAILADSDAMVAQTTGQMTGELHNQSSRGHSGQKADRINCLDLLKNSYIRVITIIACYSWFVQSLTYYGLYLMSGSISEDRFFAFFLNAAVEVPAILTAYFAMKRFGRKKPCMLLHGICGIVLLVAAGLQYVEGDAMKTIILSLTVLGKYFIGTTFALVYVYTPEMFPTNLRSAGLGVASATSRVGAMIAPFARFVAESHPWLPGTVFGGCCLLVVLLTIWLPETSKEELPQTIDDVEAWGRRRTEKQQLRREKSRERH